MLPQSHSTFGNGRGAGHRGPAARHTYPRQRGRKGTEPAQGGALAASPRPRPTTIPRRPSQGRPGRRRRDLVLSEWRSRSEFHRGPAGEKRRGRFKAPLASSQSRRRGEKPDAPFAAITSDGGPAGRLEEPPRLTDFYAHTPPASTPRLDSTAQHRGGGGAGAPACGAGSEGGGRLAPSPVRDRHSPPGWRTDGETSLPAPFSPLVLWARWGRVGEATHRDVIAWVGGATSLHSRFDRVKSGAGARRGSAFKAVSCTPRPGRRARS